MIKIDVDTPQLASWIPISTGTFQGWEKIKTGSNQGSMAYKINAKGTIPCQNHLITLLKLWQC